jgi:hypothetical protein
MLSIVACHAQDPLMPLLKSDLLLVVYASHSLQVDDVDVDDDAVHLQAM